MNWIYYIPHVWVAPTAIWEDIYLYPEADNWDRPAFWVTLSAVNETTYEYHGMEKDDFEAMLDAGLGEQGFEIEGDEITVYGPPFDLDTLLWCARRWLEQNGFVCHGLRKVTHQEMSKHARSHHF